ncbi:hypothetical protein BN1050_00651 [Metalysinibacillus saudimassiliensis]|uniref:Uncharacterized protein n=1 Tax=Metalysinibacillus saudimassiliensis TaxID=1461583 RepID=A0A078M5D1_9BACL|nr:hypothetical protein BN1050_00651 [Metalysinibacillus saudimassiliensis]
MYFKEIENISSSMNWASFYLQLGRLYGEEVLRSEKSHHIILHVPYTNYLYYFIALGIADSVYSHKIESEDISDKLVPNETVVYYKPSETIQEQPYKFLQQLGDSIQIEDMKKNPTKVTVGKMWREKIRIANENINYKKARSLQNKELELIKNMYSEEVDKIARLNSHKIIIIGNKKRIEQEARLKVNEMELSSWLLLHSFLPKQSYYLTDIYSSQSQLEINELPHNTIIIYADLDAYYYFSPEFANYSSIILYGPNMSNINETEGLMDIVSCLDNHSESTILHSKLAHLELPRYISYATWEVSRVD